MYQKLHKNAGMSSQQTCHTLKHRFLKYVFVLSPIHVGLTCERNQKKNTKLINPFTKLQDFLNNTRFLKTLVTIHGRKKWL